MLETALAAQSLLEQGTTVYAGAAAAGIDLGVIRELVASDGQAVPLRLQCRRDQLTDAELHASLAASVAPADSIVLNAKLEADLAELSDEEAAELLESVGVTERGWASSPGSASHLGLQTYLTAGPKESRAWTIRQGWTAPQAAGVIHSDFQRGFIKAEVVSFADLVEAGRWRRPRRPAARSASRGKDYVGPTAM